MAFNIKNPEVVRLASELAALTGETKTEAIRVALEERRRRIALQVGEEDRRSGIKRFLEEEVWPNAPEGEIGRVWTREEREGLLGFGPEGV